MKSFYRNQLVKDGSQRQDAGQGFSVKRKRVPRAASPMTSFCLRLFHLKNTVLSRLRAYCQADNESELWKTRLYVVGFWRIRVQCGSAFLEWTV